MTGLTRVSRWYFIKIVVSLSCSSLVAVLLHLKSCEFRRKSWHVEKLVCDNIKTVKRQLRSWCEKGLTFKSSFAFYHYFRKTKIIRKQLHNATYNMEDLTAPFWILRSLYQNKKCHFLVRWRILVSLLYVYLLDILFCCSCISS